MLVRLTGYPLHELPSVWDLIPSRRLTVNSEKVWLFSRNIPEQTGLGPVITDPRAELDETFCGSCFPEQLLQGIYNIFSTGQTGY